MRHLVILSDRWPCGCRSKLGAGRGVRRTIPHDHATDTRTEYEVTKRSAAFMQVRLLARRGLRWHAGADKWAVAAWRWWRP